MKKKAIIFGINELSAVLGWLLETEGKYELIGYTLDDEYCVSEKYSDKPLIPFSKLDELYPDKNFEIFITIGYSKMNDVRKLVFNKIKKKEYKIGQYIHPSSVVQCKSIGDGNIILDSCSLGVFSVIGDGNIIWPGVTISHHCVVKDYNYFAPECTVAGCVNIENNCFLGVNCTIKNSITINDYSLIGAGVYVSKSTDEYGVYVPERSIKLDKSSMDIQL